MKQRKEMLQRKLLARTSPDTPAHPNFQVLIFYSTRDHVHGCAHTYSTCMCPLLPTHPNLHTPVLGLSPSLLILSAPSAPVIRGGLQMLRTTSVPSPLVCISTGNFTQQCVSLIRFPLSRSLS